MNILFVCRHNRFRSKVAEAYLKKLCKNKNVHAESSGIFPPKGPLNKFQVETAKNFGIRMKGVSRATSINLLEKQDLIILVADDVPKSLFNYEWLKGKVKIWQIRDVKKGSDIQGNKKSIKKIMQKVERLAKDLENKK